MQRIKVLKNEITFFRQRNDDYISLTDIARYKDIERTDYIIQNWLRSRNTIEFIGIWEHLNNPHFKPIEFDGFRKKAGLNSFVLTAKQWIEKTDAIGLISKSGRYGGTYAHKDIAFEFASWISSEFKLYLIKEFQRLKADEGDRKKLDWNVKRSLAALNYKIHTEAIRENLIPKEVTKFQMDAIYALEADLLNVALFGKTAKEWREANPNKTGNMRDCSNISQLVCLSNLENLNALFIKEEMPPKERLEKLNRIAIAQMKILIGSKTVEKLSNDHRLWQKKK
jgi:hypothetical protein